MRKLVLALTVAVVGGLAIAGAVALAHDNNGNRNFSTKLNGFNEVIGGPGATSLGSVSTTARGSLKLRIESNKITFRLRYRDMEGGTVSVAHIHFAQKGVSGGIIAFLCGGGGEAACTTPNGDISGEITPAEIIGPIDQGIEAGSFAEAVRAIRAGAVYGNVHSTPRFPEGEIRGQLFKGHGHGHGNGGDKGRK
jgi:CHRD domain